MSALAVLGSTIRRSIIIRFYKYYILDSILIVKRQGFRELLRQRGWRIVLVVGGYYLVRDTIVYIIIPYCVARGLF
jgi:hypothetical protein